MGTDGMSHVPGASWVPMTDHQKIAIVDASKYIEIVPFSGSTIMKDPNSIAGWREPFEEGVDYGLMFDHISSFSESWRKNVYPWIQLGTKTFVLDAAAMIDRRDHFVNISGVYDKYGINLMGEAVPLVYENGTAKIDSNSVSKMSWMETLHLSQLRHPEMHHNKETTRIFVWWEIRTSEMGFDDQLELLLNYMDRGWIPILNINAIGLQLYQHAIRKWKSDLIE